jgi:hypothetical protein
VQQGLLQSERNKKSNEDEEKIAVSGSKVAVGARNKRNYERPLTLYFY